VKKEVVGCVMSAELLMNLVVSDVGIAMKEKWKQ